MKLTSQQKAIKAVKDYADNRRRLRKVQNMVSSILQRPGLVDMNRFYNGWFGDPQDNHFQPPPWRGWVAAINETFDEATQEEMIIARLWDARRKLNVEGGQIRRRICAIGRAMHLTEEKNDGK